jgi:hypothetical protein
MHRILRRKKTAISSEISAFLEIDNLGERSSEGCRFDHLKTQILIREIFKQEFKDEFFDQLVRIIFVLALCNSSDHVECVYYRRTSKTQSKTP